MFKSTTNRLLGYPDDARLLIVNVDDFGMYTAINEAIPRALRDGVVRSTSLMVPCPGAREAMAWLRANPEVSFGVHLTLIREYAHVHWGPVAPRDRVPTLLDEAGEFYTYDRMAALLGAAHPDQVAIEYRAQIEAVLAAGLHPTHLDWHSLPDGGGEDALNLMLALAREYGLAMRVSGPPFLDRVRGLGLPAVDHGVVDSYHIPMADKPARSAQMLRELPEGLSEWAVHPSTGDIASRAIDPDGWRIRRADYAWLTSPEAREAIEREGITLLDYFPLQAVWRQHGGV